jgi:glycosyltransferase involved in cell wall biosynthesis
VNSARECPWRGPGEGGRKDLKIAAIIPAYNEAGRLGQVLGPLLQASEIDEIVIVDDGSTDDTAAVARRFSSQSPRVRVIESLENLGKGGAMRRGALNTDAETILFLDADLIGFQSEHATALAGPVARGECDMTIGVFRGGRGFTDLSHFLAAWISGQRAMRRQDFLAIAGVARSRSGIETVITLQARQRRWRVAPVAMHGVTHTMKEEKIGLLRGLLARFKMYVEIAQVLRNCREVQDDATELAEQAAMERRESAPAEEGAGPG